ncbi:MAG: NAD-dependent epimerase/dehydratase family protein [Acidimicrobiales bacterium]
MTSGYLDEDETPGSDQGFDQGWGIGFGHHSTGKRVVVTGAAGFIGSHLVDHLLAADCEVIGIDNFDPWYDRAQKQSNLSAAARNPGFSLLARDMNGMDLKAAFNEADVVFHLAARPGVQDSWGSGFADSCQLNVALTQQVFEAALAADVGRVVYASSSSVYGDGARSGSRAVEPISPYGVSKAAGEQLAAVYRRRGLGVINLRFFTVFGPRQRPDMAMFRLIEATGRSQKPFSRRGTGEQRREFTFVGDVVAAAAAVGLSPHQGESFDTHSKLACATFDVGGGCTASLNEVIETIEKIAGVSPAVVDAPSPPGDPQLTVADIAPLCDLVGWKPSTTLADGLRRQWMWQTLAEVPATLSRPTARVDVRIEDVESPIAQPIEASAA